MKIVRKSLLWSAPLLSHSGGLKRMVYVPSRGFVHTEEETAQEIQMDQRVEAGQFKHFDICPESQETLRNMGVNYLFPIQVETFNIIFSGMDVIGKDRTGSGKTIAFSLPILERLRLDKKFDRSGEKGPLVLIVVPTRELCVQVANELTKLKNSRGEFKVLSVYGGVSRAVQINELARGVDIVVGTPGRLKDLLRSGFLSFSSLQSMILDETDAMLDIGFAPDIEELLSAISDQVGENDRKLSDVQFLLFSATVPRFVQQISQKFMKQEAIFIDMVKEDLEKIPSTITHFAKVFNNYKEKIDFAKELIYKLIKTDKRVLVFTERKSDADLCKMSFCTKFGVEVIHGDISQDRRETVLKMFRSKKLLCLVGTDVASRGIDIPNIDMVIHMGPPRDPVSYVHRAGRTGRAGKSGTSLMLTLPEEQDPARKISKELDIKFRKFEGSELESNINSEAQKAPELKFSTFSLFSSSSGSRDFGSGSPRSRSDLFERDRKNFDIIGGETVDYEPNKRRTAENGRSWGSTPKTARDEEPADPSMVEYVVKSPTKIANFVPVLLEVSKKIPDEFLQDLGEAKLLPGGESFRFRMHKEKAAKFDAAIQGLALGGYSISKKQGPAQQSASARASRFLFFKEIPDSVPSEELERELLKDDVTLLGLTQEDRGVGAGACQFTAEFESASDAQRVLNSLQKRKAAKPWLECEFKR